jgi:hypothetical protein
VPLEVDARLLQQLDGILGVHVLAQVEPEVELVAVAAVRRRLAAFVAEGDPQLDDLEQVDVALERLVRVPVRELVADRLRDDARELRVHRDIRVLLYELPDARHVAVERRRPDVADLDHLPVRARVDAAAARLVARAAAIGRPAVEAEAANATGGCRRRVEKCGLWCRLTLSLRHIPQS